MPVGYFWTVVSAGLFTVLALVPQRRPRALASLSFLSAAIFNELPFVVLAYLLASTLLALGQGDLRGSGGAACAGLAGLTAAGLAAIVWRASRTRPAAESALSAVLGEDWRSELDPGLAARLRRRLPLARILFLPLPRRPRGVERVADISYGGAGKRQSLDLYHPRFGQDGGRPALIHLHGGGFRHGKKSRQARPLLYRLASQGWVCVSANYRLRPQAQLADSVSDAKSVLAWLRTHGDSYGVDPRMVFVTGTSAGAQLAAFAALEDRSVAAAVCFGGYYGPVDDSASLSSVVADRGATAAPIVVLHGELDTLVPATSAREFAARLRDVSANPVVYAELPWGQHTFDLFHSIRFETVVDAVEAFAAWVRSRTGDDFRGVGRSIERQTARR